MNRRQFLATVSTAGASLAAATTSHSLLAADEKKSGETKGLIVRTTKLTPPANGAVPVALLVSDRVNVIDFSGPWGVFESVDVPNSGFEIFAVAETLDIVRSASGLKIKPDYTFTNVPEVKVVVIPAQKGSDAMRDWLRKISQTADVTMSVCTGAFQLAKAGLLNGKIATTHHEYLDQLERDFPEIQVKRGIRFVENEKISTAGGLTSGTDLALRVVERYFGRSVAERTANYMEYQGKGWII